MAGAQKPVNRRFEECISIIGGVTAVSYGLHLSPALIYNARRLGGFTKAVQGKLFLRLCRQKGIENVTLEEVTPEPEDMASAPAYMRRKRLPDGIREVLPVPKLPKAKQRLHVG